jgi:hypothetical protein
MGKQMDTEFWLKNPNGKIKFQRLRHRWEDNIEMDLM